MLLLPSALGAWKEVSKDQYSTNKDLLKYSLIQVQIKAIDVSGESVSLMVMNSNADFIGNINLKKGESYTFKDIVRLTAADFKKEGSVDMVKITVEYLVDIEVLGHTFPSDMEVGKLYEAKITLNNKGAENERVAIDIILDSPYLKTGTTRMVQRINPQVKTTLSINLEPLAAIDSGKATVRISWDDGVLTEFDVSNISIDDNSNGRIEKFIMPPSLMVGESYSNKAEIYLKNYAGATGSFKIMFYAQNIKFKTGSKFGDDIMVESIGPNVTKHLYIPNFTPLESGEQDVLVELYSNGKIVDKLVKTVQVGSFGAAKPVSVKEEVSDVSTVTPVAEVTVPAKAEVSTEVEEKMTSVPITGDAIKDVSDTVVEQKGSMSKILLVLALVVIGVLAYRKVMSRHSVTEKQLRQLDRRVNMMSVRQRKKKQ
ncbi:hypothetical protein COV93_03030 [Candidatus Woesearchaeota archaeon CG11_big_fil_rev_8_21_14_0_20_43_8]|nr:MAG: hypothetical protein COV93_03030 [Candidatus Woesearchaeota archaeon CG11_big_fil_rev_8_21_14_0_20_43_8]